MSKYSIILSFKLLTTLKSREKNQGLHTCICRASPPLHDTAPHIVCCQRPLSSFTPTHPSAIYAERLANTNTRVAKCACSSSSSLRCPRLPSPSRWRPQRTHALDDSNPLFPTSSTLASDTRENSDKARAPKLAWTPFLCQHPPSLCGDHKQAFAGTAPSRPLPTTLLNAHGPLLPPFD